MTSFQLHHHNYVTEKRHQNNVAKFFHFAPPQLKFLDTPVLGTMNQQRCYVNRMLLWKLD